MEMLSKLHFLAKKSTFFSFIFFVYPIRNGDLIAIAAIEAASLFLVFSLFKKNV